MSSAKRESVSRREVRLREEGSGTTTSISGKKVQVEGVEELDNEEVTSKEVPMTIQGETQPGKGRSM